MFVFFAAGLAGLGAGHVLPSTRRALSQRTWTRVIGSIVGVIVLLGFLFSLLQRGLLSFISTPLKFILDGVAKVIFFVVIVPLVFVLEFLISAFFRLLQRFAGEPPEAQQELEIGAQDFMEQFMKEAEPSEPSIWLQVAAGIGIALLVGAALYVLARAYRRNLRWRRVDEEGDRESLPEEFDPTMDLARLLFGLLPERFRRRRADSHLRLPEGEQNIVDVFRIYFGMLTVAESRGQGRRVSETPGEHRAALARVLPNRLVQMATEAFNRACYGRRPSTREQITEMQQLLEQASDDKWTTDLMMWQVWSADRSVIRRGHTRRIRGPCARNHAPSGNAPDWNERSNRRRNQHPCFQPSLTERSDPPLQRGPRGQADSHGHGHSRLCRGRSLADSSAISYPRDC